MEPIGEGLRPCSKNIVEKNASASIGVGLGVGVGLAIGVGVGDATDSVLVETEPQPAIINTNPESKKTIGLRKRRPPDPGTLQAEGRYPIGELPQMAGCLSRGSDEIGMCLRTRVIYWGGAQKRTM